MARTAGPKTQRAKKKKHTGGKLVARESIKQDRKLAMRAVTKFPRGKV